MGSSTPPFPSKTEQYPSGSRGRYAKPLGGGNTMRRFKSYLLRQLSHLLAGQAILRKGKLSVLSCLHACPALTLALPISYNEKSCLLLSVGLFYFAEIWYNYVNLSRKEVVIRTRSQYRSRIYAKSRSILPRTRM